MQNTALLARKVLTPKLTRKALAIVLNVLSVLLVRWGAQAQCTGQPEWQSSYTNLTRCGLPGYLTNDTYYSIQEDQSWTWKRPASGGTATAYSYTKAT